ncbi:hypothetical protein LTR10_021570 [Elasticomyces elasticus]|uniref:Post-SET domain-containing protein n=1 Tax=Exophiala sideris TaxID=1016849 RepID=A0ABR0JJE6_9EURO|nr:hypothetical protein LTR10_021570 [Elasticomyces elasticus]KAK5035143.1 hypothetical protein LTS07_002579 [Exophiala sideris]KAK5039505.1 hypothetical protein LTR13_003762 [Exophiala sideris]KAK5066067.1 hypothetical protein LTR69_002585 [Exophiala sideris]KAK5186743.1 hypothetical protein LTR44_000749 [Eurotiomycetes sp. CCFEE 6388]
MTQEGSPSTSASPLPESTHPSVIKVVRRPGDFSSYSVSTTSLPPGALMARLTSPPLTFADRKRWSSVQVSENKHIELNCDFLYINHSCEPSLEFHVIPDSEEPVIEVRVASRRDENGNPKGVSVDDVLTFFYPSTEWEMDQPFQCNCGTRSCKGRISGAKDMPGEQLRGYFLNAHIEDLRSIPSDSEGNKRDMPKQGGW